jgi:hypothetical protein
MKKNICIIEAVLLFIAIAWGSAMAGPITFTDINESAGMYGRKKGIGVAFGDYDNDGDQDIYLTLAGVLAIMDRNNRLFQNEGNLKFTNVATDKGVDGVTPEGQPGIGRGTSWGDCDCDGDLDLLVGNIDMDAIGSDPLFPLSTLYINSGPPNYDFQWTSCSRGLKQKGQECTDEYRGGMVGTSGGFTWGDYNNDGCLDIYWRCTDWHVDNLLLKNIKLGGKCTCTFTDVTRQAGVKQLYPLRHMGFTTPATGLLKQSLVVKSNSQGNSNWVDYDNDGDLDLFNPNEGDMNILFRNDGNGSFTDVTTVKGREGNVLSNIGDAQGACVGDVDNDGDIDFYIANAGQANRLIRNDLMENGGNPGFTDMTFEELVPIGEDREPRWPDSGAGDMGDVRGCAMADWDNDGYLDIYVNNGGPTNILKNDEQILDMMRTQFYVAASGDYNTLLRNNGPHEDGFVTFSDVSDGSGSNIYGEGRGVASGDIDDDGRLDLYVTNQDLTADGGREHQGVMLRNTTENSNNWVKVALKGTVSNVTGIGARVKCVSSSYTQIREINAGHGYNSSDDQRAHFGLGTDTKVTLIEVTWPAPNASVQTLSNADVNKIYICTEGSGCAAK